MSKTRRTPETQESVDLRADVLVIGGGPAGAWAAIEAAGRGATEHRRLPCVTCRGPEN